MPVPTASPRASELFNDDNNKNNDNNRNNNNNNNNINNNNNNIIINDNNHITNGNNQIIMILVTLPAGQLASWLRPISVPRFWTSEGLTQA